MLSSCLNNIKPYSMPLVCRLKERGLPCSGNKEALLARLEAGGAAEPPEAGPGLRAGRTAGAAAAAGAASGGRQGQCPPTKAAAKPQARQNFVRINMRARPLARTPCRTMLPHDRLCSLRRCLGMTAENVVMQGGGRFKFKSKSGSNGSTKRFKRFPRGRGAGCAPFLTWTTHQQMLFDSYRVPGKLLFAHGLDYAEGRALPRGSTKLDCS